MVHYYFVYELSYNDKPFYVGFSKWPYSRFKQHIHDPASIPSNFIRYMLYSFEMLPTIKIISCNDNRWDIREMETEQINKRLSEGVELLNNNPYRMPKVAIKRGKRTYLTIQADLDIQQNKLIKEYEKEHGNN